MQDNGKSAVELDPEVLEQLERVGGKALVEELFGLYLTHTPTRLDGVREGFVSGDLEGIARAVHSLRSSSATLGAAGLAERLAAVESAAQRGASDEVGELWPLIERAVEALLADLRDRLERP